MDAKVTWQGDMSFVGTADSGCEVKLDSSELVGGHDDGFRPTELLAIGIVGCTGMDVISILRKKRVQVDGFEVRVHVEKAEQHPKVFTHLNLEYIFTGKNLNPADLERAIQLSEEKYCPSMAMFRQIAQISRTVTINEG